MIKIDYTDLRIDGGHPRDAIEVMLNVVANVSVRVDSVEVLSQPEFPIVELAAQLKYWLEHENDKAFEYRSAEAEDILLWFRPESGGWRVGSDWQKAPSDRLFELEVLREAAKSYINRVTKDVRVELGLDVRPAMGLRR